MCTFLLLFVVLMVVPGGHLGAVLVGGTQVWPGGVGPSGWNHSQWHSMGLNDYYQQTSDCKLFYQRTALLRKGYHALKAQGPHDQMARLYAQVQEQQPARFSCPW